MFNDLTGTDSIRTWNCQGTYSEAHVAGEEGTWHRRIEMHTLLKYPHTAAIQFRIGRAFNMIGALR